ncbi:MAG: hypothetical protein MUE73_20695 [Planctomycetes bacterium]|nr:hypothetical protein [Planctomycetota bacterium]
MVLVVLLSGRGDPKAPSPPEAAPTLAAPPAGTAEVRDGGPAVAAPDPAPEPAFALPPGLPWGARLLAQKPVRRFGLLVWSAAPDSARERLSLPVSTTAEQAKEELAAAEVLIPGSDEVWCAGDRVSHEELKLRLSVLAGVRRDDGHSMAPSLTPALLTVGAEVRWREVQWVMMACADPVVRMVRLHWAVTDRNGTEGCVPCFIPLTKGLRGAPSLVIELERRSGETRTRVKLPGEDLGTDGESFALLADRVRGLLRGDPPPTVQINAWAWVPFAEVVRVVDMVRGAGGREILFTGAPPPPK